MNQCSQLRDIQIAKLGNYDHTCDVFFFIFANFFFFLAKFLWRQILFCKANVADFKFLVKVLNIFYVKTNRLFFLVLERRFHKFFVKMWNFWVLELQPISPILCELIEFFLFFFMKANFTYFPWKHWTLISTV